MKNSSFRRSTARPSRQAGVTLIEALVALLVMSFGMVALVSLLGNLRYSGDVAKQRSEAMRLAQAELEGLRSFAVLKRAAGASAPRDYENDVKTLPEVQTIAAADSNTTFTLSRQVWPLVKDQTEPQGRTVSVTVAWQDRSGVEQRVNLHTVISRTDPVVSSALSITPPTTGIRTPDGRNPVIPVGARKLDDGVSVFRPSRDSVTVWVFNNATGVITGKCEIDVNTALTDLTPSSVDSCKNNTVGYLVAGTVRFSATKPANPTTPEAPAQSLSVYLDLKPSQFVKPDGTGLLPGGEYPITPSYECFNDAPASPNLNQTFVNYNCIVYPNNQSPRNWWGQVLLSGLDLGATASQFRVCRYSADYNHNGYVEPPFVSSPNVVDRIDNEEHPAVYRHVSYSLTRQNFLVVRGDVSCPTASAPDPSHGIFVDYSTVQIQPS